MLYATMRIGNNCEYFLFQSVIDLFKLNKCFKSYYPSLDSGLCAKESAGLKAYYS